MSNACERPVTAHMMKRRVWRGVGMLAAPITRPVLSAYVPSALCKQNTQSHHLLKVSCSTKAPAITPALKTYVFLFLQKNRPCQQFSKSVNFDNFILRPTMDSKIEQRIRVRFKLNFPGIFYSREIISCFFFLSVIITFLYETDLHGKIGFRAGLLE